MFRTLMLVLLPSALLAARADVWLLNPAAQHAANPALRAVLPNVQAVRTDDRFVYVESAGLSLQSLAPLQVGDRQPPNGVRKFLYHLPLEPKPGASLPVPLDVTGTFLNGVPIYNPVSPISWQDQNLWHFDSVRQAGDPSPLVASLLASRASPPPLIGYALDGFPIYGPAGFRSGYRLRRIMRRSALPDGTELTPEQEGPPVSPENPLGTFAEDYEYVAGSGDLDEHNGRSINGHYAYFLTTEAGRPAFPYLIGRTYFGDVEDLHPSAETAPIRVADNRILLSIRNSKGQPIRYIERTHEMLIHLAVVSEDLADFAHIHPELQPDGLWAVDYTFPRAGRYSLYADYTKPGETPQIHHYEVDVTAPAHPLVPPPADDLQVTMTLQPHLCTGEDLTFRFDVSETDLQPYLGAWAHIIIISEDRQEFIHVHPADLPGQSHTHELAGPSPSSVTATTGFRRPGLYKLWVQFQRQGRVITVPFTFRVEPGATPSPAPAAPADAILVSVSSSGFSPARIEASPGKPLRLAFRREDAQNCASAVVFPDLGIRRDLPPGETVLVELPELTKDLAFACGMNMFRGSLIVR